ncbi:MAG: hypothetical protein EZS28_009860 [Streblomastix strix]|uniref:Uncharacterized protein n=1 Tax=Streblomastix strix TaxID=222440 RepID=A0A5J4WIR0_9EUKA|nr:MAG: hypothetical protein EZS28_009860 [Streblomastix strix]
MISQQRDEIRKVRGNQQLSSSPGETVQSNDYVDVEETDIELQKKNEEKKAFEDEEEKKLEQKIRQVLKKVGITKNEIEEAIRTSGKEKSSSQIEKELEKLKAKEKGQNLRKQQKHKCKDKDQFKDGDGDEDIYIDSDTNGVFVDGYWQ